MSANVGTSSSLNSHPAENMTAIRSGVGEVEHYQYRGVMDGLHTFRHTIVYSNK